MTNGSSGPKEEKSNSSPKDRRLSLMVPYDTYRKLMLRKLDEDRSLSSIISDAIEVYLSK